MYALDASVVRYRCCTYACSCSPSKRQALDLVQLSSALIESTHDFALQMLRWLNGGTSATTADSKDDTGSHKDDAPLFPMPGSIQRVANGLKSGRDAMQAEGQDDEPDEDDEDEHRDAMASLDLHISPPWPERTGEVSARQSATSVSKSSNSDPLDEFKAPSFSLSISSPSTNVTTDRLKSKPKPSHRAFPPEPISEASTLNNGRVTVSNGNVKANQQSLGSSLGLPPSTTVKPRKQRFVALEPGYSPLDWARLNREGDDDELRVS